MSPSRGHVLDFALPLCGKSSNVQASEISDLWQCLSDYLGGGFKYGFMFTLIPGEMIQFDEQIFEMGWFNHQLVVAQHIFELKSSFFHRQGGLDIPIANITFAQKKWRERREINWTTQFCFLGNKVLRSLDLEDED